MATDAAELANLFARDPVERDRALWRAADEVMRSLHEHYGPPDPPALLSTLRGNPGPDELARRIAGEPGFGAMFGRYRASVLEYEERCARRLEVLRGTANTLLRLRERAGAERVDPMLEQLAAFVASAWRLDLGLDANRDWALRCARRYDLLPPSWRHA